jgi:uncharacterized protein YyaL (SSP411 family)
MGVISRRYLPNKVLAGHDPEGLTETAGICILNSKKMIANKPTAYLCKKHVCHAPITDSETLADLLDKT